MKSLSLSQAKKLSLLSQGLLSKVSKTGNKLDKTLAVFNKLGYVQIDTISVVQRAHHHTLFSRNSHYNIDHLDQLVANKDVFEYWSHAAAYLPMQNYRFTLPRKAALKRGDQKHWFTKDKKMMSHVLARIENEGPLMAKDFASQNIKSNGWGAKPTKQALEMLFMQGDLMITERKNFHKVYDLTSRVLPNTINTSIPTNEEHGQFLVLNYLKAHGFGTLSEITYLLKNSKAQITQALNELVESKAIERILINKTPYFTCDSALNLLNDRLNKKQAKIISPFDNLLIQRKRARTIFEFDYLLECYVPEAKRQFGYFCLPILWDGNLVARADCKVDKTENVLNVNHLHLEPKLKNQEAFFEALDIELISFAKFNGCQGYAINKVSNTP